MEEEEYVFEYTLDQLTFEYLFSSPSRYGDLVQFLMGVTLLLIAISLNILLFLVVMGSSTLRRNSSYYFVILMCLSDLVQLFISVYTAIYMTFRQAIMATPFSRFNQLIYFANDASYWTYVCTLAVVAVERMVCVAFPIDFKV
ncbi:hypothetical protein PMAYCL1PPCAC_13171, partial [Pristionchus mayeri]